MGLGKGKGIGGLRRVAKTTDGRGGGPPDIKHGVLQCRADGQKIKGFPGVTLDNIRKNSNMHLLLHCVICLLAY